MGDGVWDGLVRRVPRPLRIAWQWLDRLDTAVSVLKLVLPVIAAVVLALNRLVRVSGWFDAALTVVVILTLLMTAGLWWANKTQPAGGAGRRPGPSPLMSERVASPLVATAAPKGLVEQLREEERRGEEIAQWLSGVEESRRRMSGDPPAWDLAGEWEQRVSRLLDDLPLHQEHFLFNEQSGILPGVTSVLHGPHAPRRQHVKTRVDRLRDVIRNLEGEDT